MTQRFHYRNDGRESQCGTTHSFGKRDARPAQRHHFIPHSLVITRGGFELSSDLINGRLVADKGPGHIEEHRLLFAKVQSNTSNQ